MRRKNRIPLQHAPRLDGAQEVLTEYRGDAHNVSVSTGVSQCQPALNRVPWHCTQWGADWLHL
jgi:hypothetical protein